MTIKNEEALLKNIEDIYDPTPYLTINIYKDANKYYPEKQSLNVDYCTEGEKDYGNDTYDFEPAIKEFLAVEKM